MNLVRNTVAKQAADMTLHHARAGDFNSHQLSQLIMDLAAILEAQQAQRKCRGQVLDLMERMKERK